jgi:hypothetical protein
VGLHYRPILTGREGEFQALAHLSGERWRALSPVMELTQRLTDTRTQSGIVTRRTSAREASRLFRDKVLDYFTTDMRLAVDAAGVLPDESLPPGVGILAQLVFDLRTLELPVVPVLRPGDTASLADLPRVAPDRGVMIRLRQSDLVLSSGELGRWVGAVERAAGVERAAVDLLLDLGPVRTVKVSALLDSPLVQLMKQAGWRSRTIASGAFPRDLSRVREWELTEIPRRDASLWHRLRDLVGDDLDFSDYAVAYPAAASRRSAPPPQLRYTVEGRWLVVKGPRHQAHQFFEVCRRVRGHPEFTELGEADRLIARRAHEGPAGGLRSGSPSTWRALSTAHHLDFVSDHLVRTAEP